MAKKFRYDTVTQSVVEALNSTYPDDMLEGAVEAILEDLEDEFEDEFALFLVREISRIIKQDKCKSTAEAVANLSEFFDEKLADLQALKAALG